MCVVVYSNGSQKKRKNNTFTNLKTKRTFMYLLIFLLKRWIKIRAKKSKKKVQPNTKILCIKTKNVYFFINGGKYIQGVPFIYCQNKTPHIIFVQRIKNSIYFHQFKSCEGNILYTCKVYTVYYISVLICVCLMSTCTHTHTHWPLPPFLLLNEHLCARLDYV